MLGACCGAMLLFGWSVTGWKALAIPTGSMRPAIPPGSLVLVHRVPTSTLKVGDVITYINPFNPKTTLSHRIIKEYMLDGKVPAFITKGDANKIPDVPITIGSVKGKVVWHLPDVGYWLMDAKNPWILLPIVYTVAVLIMIEEVLRLRDYYKIGQGYQLKTSARTTKLRSATSRRIAFGISISAVIIIVATAFGPTALALLKSNTVSLINNRLSVAKTNQCLGGKNNNTTITVNNNSSQSATSGNASNSSGSGANSGNASNNNSTNVNVTVTNC